MGLRPMLYYYDGGTVTLRRGTAASAATMLVGTPAMWWLALPVLGWGLWRMIGRLDWRYAARAGRLPRGPAAVVRQPRPADVLLLRDADGARSWCWACVLVLGQILGPSADGYERRGTGLFVVALYVGMVVANFVWLWSACLEVARRREGGRAGVEGDALAVDDEARRQPPDLVLLLGPLALAHLERALRAGGLRRGTLGRDRAAVSADEPALGLQGHEVLADRDLGDAEPAREVRDARTPLRGDELGDQVLALAGEDLPAGGHHLGTLSSGRNGMSIGLRIGTVTNRNRSCQ